MRKLALILFSLAVACGCEIMHPPYNRGQEPQADRVAKLLEQLGDDDFDRREAAGQELIAMGEKILPRLRALARMNPDLEVRRRIEAILEGITPELWKSKFLGTTFARIDPGDFLMGSPAAEKGRRPDEPQHPVRISRTFYLGVHEVTQAEYEQLMGSNPSYFRRGGGGQAKVAGQDTSRYPVETVSWYDALDYCNRLSQKDGYPLHYRLDGIERENGSIQKAAVTHLGGNGYRLPTEAEWEWSCRARTESAFWYGRETEENQANLKAILVSIGYGSAPKFPELGRTTRVGSYRANPWALHDTHGNVAEWCWDWYDRDYYNVSPKADPSGPGEGVQRVVRGGSWLVTDGSSRSAGRIGYVPHERQNTIGFRIARTP